MNNAVAPEISQTIRSAHRKQARKVASIATANPNSRGKVEISLVSRAELVGQSGQLRQ
jgi:hypothetical protein